MASTSNTQFSDFLFRCRYHNIRVSIPRVRKPTSSRPHQLIAALHARPRVNASPIHPPTWAGLPKSSVVGRLQEQEDCLLCTNPFNTTQHLPYFCANTKCDKLICETCKDEILKRDYRCAFCQSTIAGAKVRVPLWKVLDEEELDALMADLPEEDEDEDEDEEDKEAGDEVDQDGQVNVEELVAVVNAVEPFVAIDLAATARGTRRSARRFRPLLARVSPRTRLQQPPAALLEESISSDAAGGTGSMSSRPRHARAMENSTVSAVEQPRGASAIVMARLAGLRLDNSVDEISRHVSNSSDDDSEELEDDEEDGEGPYECDDEMEDYAGSGRPACNGYRLLPSSDDMEGDDGARTPARNRRRSLGRMSRELVSLSARTEASPAQAQERTNAIVQDTELLRPTLNNRPINSAWWRQEQPQYVTPFMHQLQLPHPCH